jgi:hypothetical protein
MDMGTTLMLSILFGSIGAGYFLYGKKQQQFVPLLTRCVCTPISSPMALPSWL